MKTLLFTIGIILTQAIAFAQDDRAWTLYKSVDGVEIYTQEIDCYAENIPAQKAILVRVVNTNSYACTIEWDLSIWYNDEEVTANVRDGENHHTISLEPNQKVEGSCDTPYGAFYIFKDFITYVSPTKLTKFELENTRVAKI